MPWAGLSPGDILPFFFSQGLDGQPKLSWAHPGTWDLPGTGEGLAPEGRLLRSTAASLTRDPE